MTIYDEVKDVLEANTDARERKYKDRFLLKLVLKKIDREGMTILPVSELIDFAKEFTTYDRAWRQVLQHRQDLRGQDYEQKKILTQKRKIELGYDPLFSRDIKMGKQLSL